MDEFEEFVQEAVSGMVKKALSFEEEALRQFESWMKCGVRLALSNEDEIKPRVESLIKTMTTPSSLFYVGFLHGYAYQKEPSSSSKEES